MSDSKFRVSVQNTITNYVVQLMDANNIPASMMEDALNKAMLVVKERQLQELLLEMEVAENPQEEEE